MKKLSEWFEIFRAGKQTDSAGNQKTWTDDDLEKIAASYDPAKHEAPAVIGHPKTNAPAYGWVQVVKRQGNVLLAKLKQIEPSFADMVKDGRFKKRSISLYPDGTLRHIGFLGAVSPAVKGLKDFKGKDKAFSTYEFNEPDKGVEKMDEVKKLAEELKAEKKARKAAEDQAATYREQAEKKAREFKENQKAQNQKEVKNFIEQGIKDGRILPAWKDKGLEEFMNALVENTPQIEFSEGKKKSPAKWFKDFLSNLSRHKLFKEFAKPEEDDQKSRDFKEQEALASEIAGTD